MKAIYCILNKLNGNRYVGSAINFYKRKYAHLFALKNNKHHSSYLQNAWNKYGEDMFEFMVLEEVENKEELIIKEQWWLDNSECNYNICKIAGSTLGRECSDETKKKISESNSGKRTEKQIEAQKKRRKPVDQYDLLGNFIKSWTSTQEAGDFLEKNHKDIIKAACGKSNCAHGFRWAYLGEELKDIKRNNHKFIHQYDKKGNYIKTWYTIAEASKYYNISHSCIVDCAKGIQKTSAGFVWKYDKNG